MITEHGRADEELTDIVTKIVHEMRSMPGMVQNEMDEQPVVLIEFFVAAAYRGWTSDGEAFTGTVAIPSDSAPHHMTGLARRTYARFANYEDGIGSDADE